MEFQSYHEAVINLTYKATLNYGNTMYGQAYNAPFYNKSESNQYNAALAITDLIRRTSKEKLYCELGFESLQQGVDVKNVIIFVKRKNF